jgi:hypothetical protein
MPERRTRGRRQGLGRSGAGVAIDRAAGMMRWTPIFAGLVMVSPFWAVLTWLLYS